MFQSQNKYIPSLGVVGSLFGPDLPPLTAESKKNQKSPTNFFSSTATKRSNTKQYNMATKPLPTRLNSSSANKNTTTTSLNINSSGKGTSSTWWWTIGGIVFLAVIIGCVFFWWNNNRGATSGLSNGSRECNIVMEYGSDGTFSDADGLTPRTIPKVIIPAVDHNGFPESVSEISNSLQDNLKDIVTFKKTVGNMFN